MKKRKKSSYKKVVMTIQHQFLIGWINEKLMSKKNMEFSTYQFSNQLDITLPSFKITNIDLGNPKKISIQFKGYKRNFHGTIVSFSEKKQIYEIEFNFPRYFINE